MDLKNLRERVNTASADKTAESLHATGESLKKAGAALKKTGTALTEKASPAIRKVGTALTEKALPAIRKVGAALRKAAAAVRAACVSLLGRIGPWKEHVSKRAAFLKEYENSDTASGGRAGALHAMLQKPRSKGILIGCGVLVLAFAAVHLPSGTTQVAAAELTMQRESGEQVLEEPLIMDTFALSASSTEFGTVELSWEEIPNTTGYIVYRYNSETRTYDPIATITDSAVTSYTDTDVKDGENYSYQITPLIALEEKKNSEVAAVTVGVARPEISLEVQEQNVQLNWTAVDGADQYTLLRAIEEDGEYAEVAYIYDPEFLDEEMTPGRTYYYKVFAEKDGLVTATSNIENTGPIPEPEPDPEDYDSESGEGGGGSGYSSWDGGTMNWPMPANYSVCSYFGYRNAPTWGASTNHMGIDISCPYGSSVEAAAGGTVSEVSWSGARGNYVVVSHGSNISTLYQHLSSSAVYVGQSVSAGETIGYAGSTGISSGVHLHFEVHDNGVPVNPLNYL